MQKITEIIRKHVLKNAYDYGKASAGSVIGKVIGEFPDCKKDMKSTMAKINAEIVRVSALSKDQIGNEMSNFEYLEKKEKEEEKKLALPNAIKGKVITRFPPEPSGYPHIGHAKAAWLDYECARIYNGKMILRFDDTNPEKESREYVEAIKAGLKWLGVNWSDETYTSDQILCIYDTAKKLIEKNSAYVCTCDQDSISKGRNDGIGCACRNLSINEQIARWQFMLDGKYREGEAILRFKGDMKSLNTVMRDPALARIIKASHYRQKNKYRVWPSYDLSVYYMDHIEGITHSMRSKEYELRDELYTTLFRDLEWKQPTLIGFSRLEIKNAPISKRLLLPLVKEGKVMGWDDPRLPTLKGLERRGILPQAIKDFVLSFGLSKVESEPDWQALLAENRKMLDQIAEHFFFVVNPIELEVDGLKEQVIELQKHPKKDLGKRKIKVKNKVYISHDDIEKTKVGEIIRLKDLCNVKITKKGTNATDGRKLFGELQPDTMVERKIQWVGEEKLECTVLIPKDLLRENGEFNENSLERINGYCEKAAGDIELGKIIQFERFGFCRLDKKTPLIFVYSC